MAANEAIQILLENKEYCEEDVLAIRELPDYYLFSIRNDDEGYDIVYKNTGEVGFKWIWEYADDIRDT